MGENISSPLGLNAKEGISFSHLYSSGGPTNNLHFLTLNVDSKVSKITTSSSSLLMLLGEGNFSCSFMIPCLVPPLLHLIMISKYCFVFFYSLTNSFLRLANISSNLLLYSSFSPFHYLLLYMSLFASSTKSTFYFRSCNIVSSLGSKFVFFLRYYLYLSMMVTIAFSIGSILLSSKSVITPMSSAKVAILDEVTLSFSSFMNSTLLLFFYSIRKLAATFSSSVCS